MLEAARFKISQAPVRCLEVVLRQGEFDTDILIA